MTVRDRNAGDAAAGAQPATPGSYGAAPAGGRLPPDTRPGAVRLQVAELERSIVYYETVLGMRVLARTDQGASLGAQGAAGTIIELVEQPGAQPAGPQPRLGLYHFALLLPDRAALGSFVRHLAESGVRAGAGDHLVSEAFYLHDPDGLGIEVYADRPRATWRRVGRELLMATDPVDVAAVVDAAGGRGWRGMPAGTVLGHVHLHVGDLDEAAAFYAEALGFDRMVWSYPGALFLGAGGYHHHLGTNLWAGAGAKPAGAQDARLLEWTLELPDATSIDALQERLERGGYTAERPSPDELVTRDPWGTPLRARTLRARG
jgi:catechol 2,3-dioxygenase